ncbi:GNAT family protein [Micromonospora sp. NPDC005237]|uniref:GNAT family N-acetyltransferase n=1 Tax=Micromonospora sp. NPDC005237 TaxID=3155113 RepID=UPI0033B6D45B
MSRRAAGALACVPVGRRPARRLGRVGPSHSPHHVSAALRCPRGSRCYLERQHQRLAEGSGYSFAIADAETDEAVGNIGLWTSHISTGRASTGYWIAPQHRRLGYVRAALSALTAWASSLDDVKRLELFVEPWNEGSWRAAEACGYQREGLLRSWQQVGTERKDMYVYSLIPVRD